MGDDRGSPDAARFEPELMYRAAQLYYLDQATQAEVAAELGTSRPTVSRLLAEARASGIVTIQVHRPTDGRNTSLEQRLSQALGLKAAHVAPAAQAGVMGLGLADKVTDALTAADLQPGDGLLVSSGATVYAAAQQGLPALPGIFVYPTAGGVDEPEAAYQTNEIARSVALKVGGTPVMLYAPALPTLPLRDVLMRDPATLRVTQAWSTAKAALLGVGAPLAERSLVPSVFAAGGWAQDHAVGDICLRPFDEDGAPLVLDDIDRLVAMGLGDLQRIPHAIALASGLHKVAPLLAAARARYLNVLVTDQPTAEALLARVTG